MSLPLVFRRRFQQDLAASFGWYEEQRPGLGEELLSAVMDVLRNIEAYPKMFACVHGDVRRAIVSRFPFGVFYLIEPHRLLVLRILHTARDPRLWPRPRGTAH